MSLPSDPTALSCDCFGTLIEADRPADPAAAVADALDTAGIDVPGGFRDAYAEPHHDLEPGHELSLVDHVEAALRACGRSATPRETVRDAVLSAFDRPVEARDGAARLVAAVDCPVGVMSNCAVPGLVSRCLDRAGLSGFDAVVTSVDCGYRKPDERAFLAIADALAVAPADLVHVGDDPETDGAAHRVGATPVLVDDHPLPTIADRLEGGQ